MDRRLAFFSACLSSLFFSLLLPLGAFTSIVIVALLISFSGIRYGLLATLVSVLLSALPISSDSLSVFLSSLAILRFTSEYVLVVVCVLVFSIQLGAGIFLSRVVLGRFFGARAVDRFRS